MAYFADGSRVSRRDVELAFSPWDEPLGTAGVRAIDDLDEPFLVMNGDILDRPRLRPS